MINHCRLAIIGLHDSFNDTLNTKSNGRRFLILRESRQKNIRHWKNGSKSTKLYVKNMEFFLRIHEIWMRLAFTLELDVISLLLQSSDGSYI